MDERFPDQALKGHAGRTTLVLLLGLPLHALLMSAVDGPGTFLGPRGQLSVSGWITLAAGALAVLLLWFRWRRPGRPPGVLLLGVAPLLPLPFHIAAFPVDSGLALTGIACCLLQGQHLLSENTHSNPSLQPGSEPPAAGAGLWFPVIILADLGLVAVAFLTCGHHLTDGVVAPVAVVLYSLLVFCLCLPLEYKATPFTFRNGPYLDYVLLLLAAVCAVSAESRPAALAFFAFRQVITGVRLWQHRGGMERFWNTLTERPARLMVFSFAGVIAIGTLLLMLPVAAAPAYQPGIGLLKALFTATSAVCVTGLIVVDTGTAFSMLGQAAILALIQIGGLGLMTIGMFVALVLGRSIGLRGDFAISEVVGEKRNRLAQKLLRFIVMVTFSIEAVGAVILAMGFRAAGMAVPQSLFYGVFHSVSAFCNAGFSLFSRSFQDFADQPLFPITLSLLIILGGLGFGVLLSLPTLLRRRPGQRPEMHVRMVLTATLVLSVLGTLVIWLSDRHGAFGHLSASDALINAWFQSVTTRTAGFNTVDLVQLSPQSDLLMRVLMIIGAAPGSTGGGIKVTTVVVLLLLVRARLRGGNHILTGGRRIDEETVVSAVVLTTLAIAVVLLASGILVATQLPADGVTPSALMYEAISAFATVGLSLGVTPHLNPAGQLTIIALMFIGRMGPLTLLVLMQTRQRSAIDYPTAKVMVG